MAKYYNKSSGPLAVALKSGRPGLLAGKSWTEIPAEEEGSEDLIRLLRKEFIVRYEVPVDVLPEETSESVSDSKTPDGGLIDG
jgi:hypothetical protein